MMSGLREYLEDPFLANLYSQIRDAGPIRSISLDITNECNLRCKGCYYFAEGMDKFGINEEKYFDDFIVAEKKRKTNFVTVVGGEPSMVLGRLKKIYDNFKVNVATNGLIKIPVDGFENMPLGIAVWGDHGTDAKLRGTGKQDYFKKALTNYRNDPRAFWYYTVAPGYSHQIEPVVEECIQNGNKVLFNYYSDVSNLGGPLDYRLGFNKVRDAIDKMIDRYPEHILINSYFNKVITSGNLFDQKWGYNVCTNLSTNNRVNEVRFKNGNLFNQHFRAYNADFSTTRRCCTGIDRDCSSCFDTWEHYSWIMINMRKHLDSRIDFTNWLTTMYLFYYINRLIDYEKGTLLLPEIHRYMDKEYAI